MRPPTEAALLLGDFFISQEAAKPRHRREAPSCVVEYFARPAPSLSASFSLVGGENHRIGLVAPGQCQNTVNFKRSPLRTSVRRLFAAVSPDGLPVRYLSSETEVRSSQLM